MYQAQKNHSKSPIVFYVSSGPGCSTSLTSFFENGPFVLDKDVDGNYKIHENPYSWHQTANIVYVDHPVGSGFSYSESKLDNIQNMSHDESILNLYEFIVKYLELYKSLSLNYVYIFGSHYNAYLVPLIASYILDMNKMSDLKIKLRGIGIGDGFINPYYQFKSMEKYLIKTKLHINQDLFTTKLIEYFKNKDNGVRNMFDYCQIVGDRYCKFATYGYNSLSNSIVFYNKVNPYNIKNKCYNFPLCYNFNYIAEFMETYKQTLNVNPNIKYNSCLDRSFLSFLYWPKVGPWANDVVKSLINLLNNDIEVLMYFGDNDYYFNYIGGLDLISALIWSGTKKFQKISFTNVYDQNNIVLAKVKSYKNLKFYIVKDSGMYIGLDNPKALFYIISRYINGN